MQRVEKDEKIRDLPLPEPTVRDNLIAEKSITPEYFQTEMLRKLQEPREAEDSSTKKWRSSKEVQAIFKQGRHYYLGQEIPESDSVSESEPDLD
jgi:hypothetical protein